jgi:hypothetical protein
MVPEDLLFWIAPISEAPTLDPSLLCRRHADAMVVPRGWTLDDRREEIPRLFNTRQLATDPAPMVKSRRHRSSSRVPQPEQMQIDGTAEIARPAVAADDTSHESPGAAPEPWQPDFDVDDNLDGLLEVESPLLARAFRGPDRPKL